MSRNWKLRPYMPLFWDDYDSDTLHLTTEEHGAYLLLIMAYWKTQKPLPADDQALASITRLSMYKWKKSSKILRRFFKETSDGLYHKRIQAELLVAMEKSQKAKESINYRWYGRNTDVLRTNNERNTDEGKGKGKGKGKEEEVTTTVTDTTVSESSQKSVLDTDVLPISKKSKSASTRGTRWPDGQAVPEKWIEDVHRKHALEGLTIQVARQQADKFVNHWVAKAGAGATKLNWELTYHVWIRNHLDWHGPAGGTRQSGRGSSITEGLQYVLDRIEDGD